MRMLVVSAQVKVTPPTMAAILSAIEHARYLIARRLLFNCVCTSACSGIYNHGNGRIRIAMVCLAIGTHKSTLRPHDNNNNNYC